MDMNEAVSKQSATASQAANIIKTQTSGKGGGRVEGGLHWGEELSPSVPSVPIKSKRKKIEGEEESLVISRQLHLLLDFIFCVSNTVGLKGTCVKLHVLVLCQHFPWGLSCLCV